MGRIIDSAYLNVDDIALIRAALDAYRPADDLNKPALEQHRELFNRATDVHVSYDSSDYPNDPWQED